MGTWIRGIDGLKRILQVTVKNPNTRQHPKEKIQKSKKSQYETASQGENPKIQKIPIRDSIPRRKSKNPKIQKIPILTSS